VTGILLIHGGLWGEGMDADRFWRHPGVVAGLERQGFDVLAPDRLPRPPDWTAETDHLLPALSLRPDLVMAGSNGCSVAVRLALARPDQVPRLLLAWPATAGDPAVDGPTRRGLAGVGAPQPTIDALLAGGGTLRGVGDDELARIGMPVGVLPSIPDSPFHQRRTVDGLLALLPDAEELSGCPEPPRGDFGRHLELFLEEVAAFARRPIGTR
jgi:pimeloyl-ACP methyl ester carboxylesterase